MVKFIPLTCEVCGGELSVKEGSKFVTCLHCHTKFQVLQENNTAFLEKLEITISVKANSYRETCEIVFQRNDRLFGGSIELWASGLGKKGEFTAGSTWEVKGEKYPDIGLSAHKDAHRCLTILLSRSGWIRTGQGDRWFNDKFERHEADTTNTKIRKLEKTFGESLFALIHKHRREVEKRLLEQNIFKTVYPYRDERYKLVSAVYELNPDTLAKVFKVSKESPAYPLFKELIAIRKEINTLSINRA